MGKGKTEDGLKIEDKKVRRLEGQRTDIRGMCCLLIS